MAALVTQAAGQDGTQKFKDVWVAETYSHPRLTMIFAYSLICVFLAYKSSDAVILIASVLVLGLYLYLSKKLEGKSEILDLFFLQGDEIENTRRERKNTLIQCFIENEIIDDNTRLSQVAIEVCDNEPLTFVCQLTQQGRRLIDIQERLEKMCPAFNAARCSTEKVNNTTFKATYYTRDIFDERESVLSWSDYYDD